MMHLFSLVCFPFRATHFIFKDSHILNNLPILLFLFNIKGRGVTHVPLLSTGHSHKD